MMLFLFTILNLSDLIFYVSHIYISQYSQLTIFSMVKSRNAHSLIHRFSGVGEGGREGGDRLEIGPIEFGAWIASNVMRRSMEFVIP